jgi:hypothetical protein
MRVLALTAAVGASLGVAAPAALAAADAHVVGRFALSGVVTKAYNVRGEYRGHRVKRTWLFRAICSAPGSCERLVVTRLRAAGKSDTVTLARIAVGVYQGTGPYAIPLECGGRRLPAGGTGRYSLTVHIRRSRRVQKVRFATRIAAGYKSLSRVNHTRCPGHLGADAASYQGRAVATPGPPAATFSYSRAAIPAPTVSFEDGSTPGRGRAGIVARQWDFGDPLSGAANADTSATPSHTYVAPGVHTVSLTVTDANGLTATTSRQVDASANPVGQS